MKFEVSGYKEIEIQGVAIGDTADIVAICMFQ